MAGTWERPEHSVSTSRLHKKKSVMVKWVAVPKPCIFSALRMTSLSEDHSGSLPRGDMFEFIGKQKLGSVKGTELRAAEATVG